MGGAVHRRRAGDGREVVFFLFFCFNMFFTDLNFTQTFFFLILMQIFLF